MTDRIDTAKERAEWASNPEWEFPEAMFGLLGRYHMALDALDAERALTTRAMDGWGAAQIAKNEALLRVGKAEKENERLREALAHRLLDALDAERARAEKAEAERDQALARLAAMEHLGADKRAANLNAEALSEIKTTLDGSSEQSVQEIMDGLILELRALPPRALTPADAQAALDKLLAEARLEGWRDGREAAAGEAMRAAEGWFIESEAADLANNVELSAYYGNRQTAAEWITAAISALPEPKEASHE